MGKYYVREPGYGYLASEDDDEAEGLQLPFITREEAASYATHLRDQGLSVRVGHVIARREREARDKLIHWALRAADQMVDGRVGSIALVNAARAYREAIK